MSNFKLWIILGIILTFTAGFMLGMTLDRSLMRKRMRAHKEMMQKGVMHEQLLARLSRKLDLTRPQIQAVGGILRLQAVKINEISGDFRNKMKAIKEETLEKILPHLTPLQQEKYQKLVESHRQRWEKICTSE